MKSSANPKIPIRDAAALIPAAGSGTRLGLGPKAFLKIDGESLIQRAVRLLEKVVGRVLVGVPADEIDRAQAEIGGIVEIHPGGATRQDTVRRLFGLCTEQLIVIHDPTHPFVTREMLLRVIDSALMNGAAMAFVHLPKPCAHWKAGVATGSIPGCETGYHQSPQAFHRQILEHALRAAIANGVESQATWELVARIGTPVHTVPGDEKNIKITTRFDWEIAHHVIAKDLSSAEYREA